MQRFTAEERSIVVPTEREAAPPDERAEKDEARGSARYRVYAGLTPVGMAPLGLVLILREFGWLGGLPTSVQWILVSLASGSTLYIVGLFAFPRSRRRWIDWNGRFGPVLPVINTFGMACYATAGFALVTAFLHLQGVAVAAPERVLEEPFNDSYAYYTWNFMNAVPYLEIPRTLGWELRLGFTDHLSPVLLLVYKLALVGPIIAIGQLVWQDVRRLRERRADRGESGIR